MTLREYLFYNRITQKDFCQRSGISQPYLTMIMSGKVKPSKRIIRDIIQATNGYLTAENICAQMPNRTESQYSNNLNTVQAIA